MLLAKLAERPGLAEGSWDGALHMVLINEEEDDQVAADLGVHRSQVWLAWGLSPQELTTALAGAESEEHGDDNLAGARLELPPEALDQLNSASLAFADNRT